MAVGHPPHAPNRGKPIDEVDASVPPFERNQARRHARENWIYKNQPHQVDLAALRKRTHMTQAGFAARFGFPVATLRHWEQGTRKPRGAALVLLNVIQHNPVLVLRALEKPRFSQ